MTETFWDHVETCRQDLLPENNGWNYITSQYLLISDYAYARQAASFEDTERRTARALRSHQDSWRPIRPWGWSDHLNKLHQAYNTADSDLKNHLYYWPSKALDLVDLATKRKNTAYLGGIQRLAGLGGQASQQGNLGSALGMQQGLGAAQGWLQ